MEPRQEISQLLEDDADLVRRVKAHEKAHKQLTEQRRQLAAGNDDRAQRRWNRQAGVWRRTKQKLLKELRIRTVGQVGHRADLVTRVPDQQTTMKKFIQSGQNMAQTGERLRILELVNFKT